MSTKIWMILLLELVWYYPFSLAICSICIFLWFSLVDFLCHAIAGCLFLLFPFLRYHFCLIFNSFEHLHWAKNRTWCRWRPYQPWVRIKYPCTIYSHRIDFTRFIWFHEYFIIAFINARTSTSKLTELIWAEPSRTESCELRWDERKNNPKPMGIAEATTNKISSMSRGKSTIVDSCAPISGTTRNVLKGNARAPNRQLEIIFCVCVCDGYLNGNWIKTTVQPLQSLKPHSYTLYDVYSESIEARVRMFG